MSTQSVMPMRYHAEIYRRSIKNLQTAFTRERTYIYLIPTDTYNGQTSLALCFKGESHPKKVNKERIDAFEKDQNLQYYNYGMHQGSLCLPNYLKKTIGIR